MNLCFRKLLSVPLIWVATKGTCSDSSIATWAGFSSLQHYPYYSIYDGNSWTLPLTIGNLGDYQTTSTIYTALNTISGETMAVWVDYPTNRPVYAIFSNGSWSSPAFISNDNTIASYTLYVSFDPTREIFLATWSNLTTSPGTPSYSIYSNGSWSLPITIDGSSGTNNSVTSSFNPNTGEGIVTWQGTGDLPYYAIYSGSMSLGSPISNSVTTYSSIFLTFDLKTNAMVATWLGSGSTSGYFSVYSGSWSTPSSIPNASAEIYQDVTSSYNPILKEVIATWVDGAHSHQVALYSTYNGNSWSTDQEVDDTLLSSVDVFSSFNETLQQTIAAMASVTLGTTQPTYFIYNGINWGDPGYISEDPSYAALGSIYIGSTRLVNPASNLSGERKKNNFGIAYEYYDTLHWNLSSSSSIAHYNIYANGVQIAQVGPHVNQYKKHNRKKSASITYTVTAVNSLGYESSPITTTIN